MITETRILTPEPENLTLAAMYLARGGLVAIPTETVYGLAANARDAAAVAAIYAAKGRPSFNPLIVHVPDMAAASEIADFNDQARMLADAFWPGPLTLVLPLRRESGIASLVTAGLDTVALRVPAHPVAQTLLRAFGGAVAAPSANPSGRISPTTAAHVLDGLDGRIAAIVDAGPCPVGVESTIIGWRDGAPALLRPGGLPAAAIEGALGRTLLRAHAATTRPDAPGQMDSHYAPAASVRLNATTAENGEYLIGFGPVAGDLSLSSAGDLSQAAARLFDVLHAADHTGRPIAVAPIPETGLGEAINDRLRRAAAPRVRPAPPVPTTTTD